MTSNIALVAAANDNAPHVTMEPMNTMVNVQSMMVRMGREYAPATTCAETIFLNQWGPTDSFRRLTGAIE